MKKYRTQLYHGREWQDEIITAARGGYLAAQEAMIKHVMKDPDMCGSEWTVRVELEYESGLKFWEKHEFAPSIALEDIF